MTARDRVEQLDKMLDFISNAPEDIEIIRMDCNEGCEVISSLAERVAAGESVENILPELRHHMQYWTDCREEFEALVSVLRAELLEELPELPTIQD